ncbi:MAG: hypothetical protein U0350_24575 [Caldilineaceae bacterium]
MSKSKMFVSLILVSLLLALAPSAVFAGPTANTHDVVTGTVDWTLPAGVCAEAPNGLAGSGQRHQIIDTHVNADGSTVITINDMVKGDAWDSTGSYGFVYENHSTEIIPANGGAHQVQMEDNFILNGKGSVGHLGVGFNWSWTYQPPAPQWPPVDNLQKHSTHGDVNCDPI